MQGLLDLSDRGNGRSVADGVELMELTRDRAHPDEKNRVATQISQKSEGS